jgi:hypothetical protein
VSTLQYLLSWRAGLFGYTLQPYYTRRKRSPPPVIVEQDVRLAPHCPEVTKQIIPSRHRANVQSANLQSDDRIISVTIIRYYLSSLNFNIVLYVCVCVCVGGGVKEERQLGRPRCRWKDNKKMAVQEVRWEEWTGLLWLRIGTISELL